jgi:hypothetical protein
MAQKKHSNESNILKITFIITIIIASSAIILYYNSIIPKIPHLPTTITFKTPDWMKFISEETEKVFMLNFTQIFQKTSNYSLFTSNSLLSISNISTKITTLNSDILSSVLYKNPNPELEDLVLNIIKPKTNTYSTLKNEVELKITNKTNYMTNIIYQILQITNSSSYVTGYITFYDGYLLYSENSEGLDIIKKSLDTKNGEDQFSEKIEVKGSMYLLLTGTEDELGYSYSTLPYAVNETASLSISIRFENNFVLTKQVFRFNDTAIAAKNLSNIKQANLNSNDFTMIDNFIVSNTKYDKTHLLFELRTM